MVELWIEQAGPKVVWHRSVGRLGSARYRAACGGEMNLLEGRLWAVKPGQPGPPNAERCQTCLAQEPK